MKVSRPRVLPLPLQNDFSLSANEKPRSYPQRITGTPFASPTAGSNDKRRTLSPKALRPPKLAKARWTPRSTARRRLERLRTLIPTTAVALHSSASPYLPTDNKYKNINKLNIYENTYELNDSLKPHDIFFTSHLLTLMMFYIPLPP